MKYLLVQLSLQRAQEFTTVDNVVRQPDVEGMLSGHVVQKHRSRKKAERFVLCTNHSGTSQVSKSACITRNNLIEVHASVTKTHTRPWRQLAGM